MLRDIADDVIRKLGLDCVITMVSGGESGNSEIVMWDRATDSYFSVKLTGTPQRSADEAAELIRCQLQPRVSSPGSVEDRRPGRPSSAA